MSNEFRNKYLELGLELDDYLMEHMDMYDLIPNGAWLVVNLKGDDEFNRQSIGLLKNPTRKKVVTAQKSGKSWTIKPLYPKSSRLQPA